MTSPGAPDDSASHPGATPSGTASPGGLGSAEDNGSAGRPPTGGPDWTDQVADLVVDSVDKVRARTTGPVLNVTHAAVYAVVAVIVAVPVLIALLAGLIKFLNWLIPGDIWIVYLIVAVMFWLVGWLLWTRRSTGAQT